MDKQEISEILGKRLRQIRQQRMMTLDDLAKVTGVSKPMLGQIERGLSSPTVATLWKIASGLGVPFASLITVEQSAHLLRQEDQRVFQEDDGKFQVFSTYAVNGSPVELFRVVILAGGRREAEAHAAGVVESLTVTEGTLTVTVQDAVYELHSGDALTFAADVPHSYENCSISVCHAHMAILYPGYPMR